MTALGPNFLVIGAAKSGTTSLAHYLRLHPDIFMARQKESHFFQYEGAPPSYTGPGDEEEFNSLVISDRGQYEQCFARAGAATARGEASVYYLCQPAAIERALAYDPGMRLVAVLRDPVERAFSAWSHKMRDGWEPEPDFLKAVADEPRRAGLGWSLGFQYDTVGLYGRQLEALFQVVPREQVHVMLYDDLVAEPARTMSALFAFLGVADVEVDSSLVMNASGRPRLPVLNSILTRRSAVKEVIKRVLPYRLVSSTSQQLRNWNLTAVPMPDESRAQLREHYRPDVERLAAVLGRELPGW